MLQRKRLVLDIRITAHIPLTAEQRGRQFGIPCFYNTLRRCVSRNGHSRPAQTRKKQSLQSVKVRTCYQYVSPSERKPTNVPRYAKLYVSKRADYRGVNSRARVRRRACFTRHHGNGDRAALAARDQCGVAPGQTCPRFPCGHREDRAHYRHHIGIAFARPAGFVERRGSRG